MTIQDIARSEDIRAVRKFYRRRRLTTIRIWAIELGCYTALTVVLGWLIWEGMRLI